MGRRVSKTVDNAADWDCTYHDYYDTSWRRIEMTGGSGHVLKQYVYGTRYVDNPVQIGVNTNPGEDDDGEEAGTQDFCDDFCWPIQDANFNVVGLVDSAGDLVERYEYTPYGERTVFTNAGSNDEATSAPLYESQRVEESGEPQAWSLCDLGHQGLFLDKELGLYDNRFRVLHPRFGRFMQRDPAGSRADGGQHADALNPLSGNPATDEYPDGFNLYQCAGTNPLTFLDPQGLRKEDIKFIDYIVRQYRLSKAGRKALHRSIKGLGKGASKRAIEQEAKGIAKLGGKFIKGAGLVLAVALIIDETAGYAYAAEIPEQAGELPPGATNDQCIRCIVAPFDAERRDTAYLFGFGAHTEVIRYFRTAAAEDRGCMTRAQCRSLYVPATAGPPPTTTERGWWTRVRYYAGGRWAAWDDPDAEPCP